MNHKVDMKNNHVLIGLKRASWLFSLIIGIIAFAKLGYDNRWRFNFPEEIIIATLKSTIIGFIGFIVFRIGIWVYKGFVGYSKNKSENK
jgi:hypothetical protein